jgi:hypothetical protein
MSDVLVRIKRAMLEGRYEFSEKARTEMRADGLTELDVVESILTAVAVYKKIRSRSPLRRKAREYLCHSKHELGWAAHLHQREVFSRSWFRDLLLSHLF